MCARTTLRAIVLLSMFLRTRTAIGAAWDDLYPEDAAGVGAPAAGLGSADMVARAKEVFKANGEEKQLAAVELGEKMKADGASSDEILAAMRAHFGAPPPDADVAHLRT